MFAEIRNVRDKIEMINPLLVNKFFQLDDGTTRIQMGDGSFTVTHLSIDEVWEAFSE